MGNTLYLECDMGISGDMTVAALLDLGADWEKVKEVLSSLPVQGFSVEKKTVSKAGLSCMDFSVNLDAAHENHDHDMDYLFGHDHEHHHEHEHDHHHDHDHDHEHHHEHEHDHDHNHEHHHDHDHDHRHHHEHRGMAEIREIINGAHMSERAKATAIRIFEVVAQAESKAHGVSVEQVHFHEVGAVDSIVDVIAAAVCLDLLDIDKVIVPRLCEGYGSVRCQHGILPIPVPATLHIVSDHNLPLEKIPVKGELITPTGAAIVAAIRTEDSLPQRMVIRKVGMGAGKRSYERPSILRAMLIGDTSEKSEKTSDQNKGEGIWKLESNLDDCSGEALGFVMEELLAAGARDVHYMPVYMKKNRPGWQLNVICDEGLIDTMEALIFSHTTTIGIRRVWMQRSVLKRESRQIDTPYGKADIKVCYGPQKRCVPEYESVARLAREQKMSFTQMYRLIEELANSL